MRLVNAEAIRRMLGKIDKLGTVTAFSDYKSMVGFRIRNYGSAGLEDIALNRLEGHKKLAVVFSLVAAFACFAVLALTVTVPSKAKN